MTNTPSVKLVLFHLTRTQPADYDDAVELVIAAEDEKAALKFAEKAKGAQDSSVWYHPSVKIRPMGVAYNDTEPGIVLTKFNA